MDNVTTRFSFPVAALLIAASFIPSPAQADCAAPDADIASCAKNQNPSKKDEITGSNPAPVVVENADGSVSIKIKNVEIMHVDEDGIRINGNIEYTGTITDTGSLPLGDGGGDGE